MRNSNLLSSLNCNQVLSQELKDENMAKIDKDFIFLWKFDENARRKLIFLIFFPSQFLADI